MKPSLKGTPAAVTLTDASLQDFALPSLTWPESWVAATAAWRKGSVLSRLSPKKSYASLKKQDAELFQALQSFAEANQHIDSALEKLIETPQHSGDLISPQERHVEDEQQITAGYQHGRKALDRVEQAIAAFLKEAGSGLHKDVQAALNTLKKAITAVHGKIEELKLTEGSQGFVCRSPGKCNHFGPERSCTQLKWFEDVAHRWIIRDRPVTHCENSKGSSQCLNPLIKTLSPPLPIFLRSLTHSRIG